MASSSSSDSSIVPLVATAAAGVAAVSVFALTALQSDMVSRRLLHPNNLQDKRHAEYVYRWTQALEKTKLQFQFFFAGGVTETNISDDEELVNTTFLQDEGEVKEFAQKLVDRKEKPFKVGRIGTDKKRSHTNELFLWLYQGYSIFQVPLTKFGTALADAMDRKMTSCTFCFVSDASAGVAGQVVADLVQATKCDSVYCVLEPLWMVYFAVICNQQTLSTSVQERILFALCRLEALRAAPNQSTILMTLPGQSTTTVLLPLLQSVFPDDRHVFAYAGCANTVQYATTRRRRQQKRNYVPQSMEEALRFSNNPTSYTTPLYLKLDKSPNVMKPYVQAMAQLPLEQADVVESWMGTVNTFLNLKEEEKVNGYLPYVLKLDYLLSDGSLDANSDRYWTVLSLLQYCLGSRSREIPSEQVDAAISWLRDYQLPTAGAAALSADERKAIQNAVFQHKLILIENKTLLDTVQPTQHWTLKAASKAGCSCCAPEEEEDEEETENMGALANKLQAFGAPTKAKTTSPMSSNNGYVDGKTTFAFDPSKFTGIVS